MTTKEKKKHGCLFYLGIAFALFLLLLAGIAGFGFMKLKGLAETYTDATPLAMPALALSPPALEKVLLRVEEFKSAMTQKRPARLILSAEEVNAIIENDKDLQQLKGKVRVSFENNQCGGTVSIPLKNLPFNLAEGRYLNGSAVFNISFANGALNLTLISLEVAGKTLPDVFMAEISKMNLAQDLDKEQELLQLMRQLSRFKVMENHLVLETGAVTEPLIIPAGMPDRETQTDSGEAKSETPEQSLEEAEKILAGMEGANLLLNPAAEQGVQGWNVSDTSYGTRNSQPTAQEGNFYFFAGANKGTSEAWQKIDLSSIAPLINQGVVACLVKGFMRDLEGLDISRLEVDFLNPDNSIIKTLRSPDLADKDHWVPFQSGATLPSGTTQVRFKLVSIAQGEKDYNSGYFDNLYFGIFKEKGMARQPEN